MVLHDSDSLPTNGIVWVAESISLDLRQQGLHWSGVQVLGNRSMEQAHPLPCDLPVRLVAGGCHEIHLRPETSARYVQNHNRSHPSSGM
jgi:hypothetical protein